MADHRDEELAKAISWAINTPEGRAQVCAREKEMKQAWEAMIAAVCAATALPRKDVEDTATLVLAPTYLPQERRYCIKVGDEQVDPASRPDLWFDGNERRRTRRAESVQLPPVGRQVQITMGVFAGFTGTVTKVDQERQRITVTVCVPGRQTPVDCEYGQLSLVVP